MGTDMFPEWINIMVNVGIGGFLWRYMARKERRADERFVRFEAKTDERFDRMEARVDERFDRFEAKLDERFDRMEDRIEGLTREVVANGRAIARIEGHPMVAAE